MKMPASSWRKIQTVIRQYPESLKLLHEREEEILQASMKSGFGDESQTEHRALLLQDEYYLRLLRETEAVAKAFDMLPEEAQKVIRLRFWTSKEVTTYEYMARTNYSVRQMKRIVNRMVRMVGLDIGELHPKRWHI